MIGNENIEASELRGCGRYQFSSGLCRGKIALHRAAILRPAFPRQRVGLSFGRLIIEYNPRAGRGEQSNCGRPNSS